jgi:TPR repeat protein
MKFFAIAYIICLALPTACAAAQNIPPASSNRDYYQPVPQSQQPRSSGIPCGHYGTPPCASSTTPAEVAVPYGATADQLFDLGSQAYARRQYPQAAGYMEKAAAMGHVRAQASLGLDYVNGTGEPRDMERAIYWLNLAASRGHRVAQAQLGDIYEEGNGVPQNLSKAFQYHLAGARQGWWQAEMRVGLDYELGYGTPRSRATAIQWLNKATTDGHDGASQQLSAMLRRTDTPARFRDMDDLTGYFSRLQGATQAASLPHFPPGKSCHEHSNTAAAYTGHYSSFYCD